jgi:hypothetical protein
MIYQPKRHDFQRGGRVRRLDCHQQFDEMYGNTQNKQSVLLWFDSQKSSAKHKDNSPIPSFIKLFNNSRLLGRIQRDFRFGAKQAWMHSRLIVSQSTVGRGGDSH